MTASEMSVEQVRERWHAAQSQKLGDELTAFSELVGHPDCCWQDLLDALDRTNMIGEDAWLNMRVKLKSQVGIEGAVRRDRGFWEETLKKLGINPQSKCSVSISTENTNG